jgi:hypothetical protein
MIIGLCGHAGCGKDTFADHLVAKHHWAKLALADPLKRICREVFAFSDTQLWGPSEERNRPDPRYLSFLLPGPGGDLPVYLSPRVALQTLGTEWGRCCYPNVWVDYALRTAAAVEQGHLYHPHAGLGPPNAKRAAGVVIPDVRFDNEVQAIRRAGGRVVRLRRPGCEGHVGVPGHRSEVEQDGLLDADFDAVLDVPEGIDFYKLRIDALLQGLEAP